MLSGTIFQIFFQIFQRSQFFFQIFRFGCFRSKKSNKNVKLKNLLHNHNILSACKNTANNFNTSIKYSALNKCDSKLYIKYHVYAKLRPILENYYVPKLDRAAYIYSNKSSKKLSEDVVLTNKSIHRQLELANKSRNYRDDSGGDCPVVVVNSIDHGRMNNELTKTYDQIYLGKFQNSIE